MLRVAGSQVGLPDQAINLIRAGKWAKVPTIFGSTKGDLKPFHFACVLSILLRIVGNAASELRVWIHL